MRCFIATWLLLFSICPAWAQTSTTPPATNPTGGDSTSQQSQPAAIPDTPAPDQNSSSSKKEHKKSALRRKLGELAPGCLNVGTYHKCKSASPSDDPKGKATVDSEYAEDMDVGNFYLNEKKNYAGAAMRFRDALQQKPNDPPATFYLAQALEGLHQIDEARDEFQTYLTLEPNGPFAGQAKKSLEKLQNKGATAKSDAKAPEKP